MAKIGKRVGGKKQAQTINVSTMGGRERVYSREKAISVVVAVILWIFSIVCIVIKEYEIVVILQSLIIIVHFLVFISSSEQEISTKPIPFSYILPSWCLGFYYKGTFYPTQNHFYIKNGFYNEWWKGIRKGDIIYDSPNYLKDENPNPKQDVH